CFLFDLVRCRCIRDPREKVIDTAIPAPYVETFRHPGGVRHVWISVERNVGSCCTSCVDQQKYFIELVPVPRALSFEMRNLKRATCPSRDSYRFIDRCDQPVVFIPHVSRIRQSARRERPCECDELIPRSES